MYRKQGEYLSTKSILVELIVQTWMKNNLNIITNKNENNKSLILMNKNIIHTWTV